ncbi:MAG: cyclophilin-like fold protein [Candidatus Hodarchaeota archaeon]
MKEIENEDLNLQESVNIHRIAFDILEIGRAEGELVRHKAPRTIETIIKVLPARVRALVYLDSEIYFELPVSLGFEKPTRTIEVGDVAFWPQGNAMCIFFKKIEPAGPVNLLGKVTKGLELFEQVKLGTNITVTLID